MLRAQARTRSGFTLLEVLLATVIAVLVMAALYAAMNVTVQQTQVTRDAVEAEDLARGVFNKFSLDLNGTLAPLPPKSGGNNAASGGTTAPAPTTPAPTAPASDGSAAPAPAPAAPTAPTDGTATTETPGATDNATAVSADYAFQGGLIGEEKKVVIYAGRVPEALRRGGNPGGTEQYRADQRQIIYWIEPGRGLFRRERPWITADGVRNSIEADPDAPDSVLLAEEATDATFQYTDGKDGWVGTWDGTAPGPDGVTPLGPPRAVKVTIDFALPSGRGEPILKSVTQIIVIRAAPGTYTPPLVDAPIDGGDNPVTDPSMGGTTPTTPTTPGGGTTPTTPTLPPGTSLPPGVTLPPGTSLPPNVKLPSGVVGGGGNTKGGGR